MWSITTLYHAVLYPHISLGRKGPILADVCIYFLPNRTDGQSLCFKINHDGMVSSTLLKIVKRLETQQVIRDPPQSLLEELKALPRRLKGKGG